MQVWISETCYEQKKHTHTEIGLSFKKTEKKKPSQKQIWKVSFRARRRILTRTDREGNSSGFLNGIDARARARKAAARSFAFQQRRQGLALFKAINDSIGIRLIEPL